MKKIIIILALFLGVCVIANASDVRIIDKINYVLDDVNSGKNYDFTINKAQLGKDLELKDSVQFENVYRTYGVFCEGMLKAESAVGISLLKQKCFSITTAPSAAAATAAVCPIEWSDNPTGTPNLSRISGMVRRFKLDDTVG